MAGDNKIEYGIERVTIWPITAESGNTITYAEDPIRVYGAVSLKLSPLGDSTIVYADNSAYITEVSNNGYEGTWESYQIPEEIQLKILGMVKDKNGAIIEKSDAKIKSFGFSYQFIGDQKDARIFAPYCSLSQRPNDEKTTKGETAEPGAYSLAFNMAPRISDKVVRIKLYKSETNAAKYDNFFDAPYEIEED